MFVIFFDLRDQVVAWGKKKGTGPYQGTMLWLDSDEVCWRRCEAANEDPSASLLSYLELFPRGRHNREAAERLEVLADGLAEDAQKGLRARLRALRSAVLGPVAANTWRGARESARPPRLRTA